VSRSHHPERLARFACHGHCRPDPARRAHHDQLLRVETDTDAMLELFDLAVTWGELEYPADTMVAPAGWTDFAERHRWRDPERVLRIFGLATDIALRAIPPAPAPAELDMAAGSGICPVLVPDPTRVLAPRLTIAGR
jgi:hypothetical protein